MDELWKSPNSIINILLKADKNDIKNNLANFIVNNFYDNISSLYQKDEPLIYIISILLKNEINSLKNKNSSLLSENERCGIILKEFRKKKEVKFFFKKIIHNMIKEMETKYSSEDIILETNDISEKIQILSFKNKNKNLKNNNNNIENDNKNSFNSFNNLYIYHTINKEKLEEKKSEYKNKEMSEYLEKIISDCNSSPNIYLNETFLENIVFSDKFEEIMKYYFKSFLQVIDLIDNLINNLLNNIELLPYSIKCICKIISILIKKKFPNSFKYEQNIFLFMFFFQNLLFPTLMNPSLNSYLNEIIITDSTNKKIQTIVKILNKLLRGLLFEKNHLTPFNWYIIEKMPKIFELFNKMCQVTLPNVIQQLINDKLPDNYKYDFFNENPNINFLYRNIYFNINELYSLIITAQKCKDEIYIDKRILSKLEYNIKKLEKLKNKKEYKETNNLFDSDFNIIEKKQVIKYFLLTDFIYNNKYDKIINITNYKKKYFSLKELKEIDTEEQKIENMIIKIKNCFYSLLFNYQLLSKNEFKEEALSDIINILKELRAHPNLNTSIDKDNKYIPLNWYIDSLLQYLPRLPKSFKKNDYEKLLNELESEITNSINELDFKETDQFFLYLKETEKEKYIYENIINLINDIDINIIVGNIIKKEKIYLDLNLKDNKLVQFFKTIMKEINEFSNLFKKSDQPNKMYNTINYFLEQIPNLDFYQLDIEFNDFLILEKRKIPEIIENYFILIKDNLEQRKIGNKNNINDIHNKIYDYIMEEIYNKLFPKDATTNDIKIYQNCFKHIWVEPIYLFKKNKEYIFDNYLPDSINYLKLFENEKSPRKKLLNLEKLFKCIYNLAIFNGDKADGADDEMPLLNYTFIKAKPERIYSNSKFVEIFLTKTQASGIEGNQLSKIFMLCHRMENPNPEDFYNLDKSDYKQNCDMVMKGILY